ncbi:fungal-specific transcription factor domain-containing protein [Xylariales sp. PMI_506]|nr:fungal-specific transcription factor domain-containing protein [Xylariales sp. PMI_506]
MGRRRTACQICAAIKSLCSQGRPCTRCMRLTLPCTYSEDDPAPTATGARRPPKTGYTRSKRGCVNCRQRRKKCDELQPTCGDCQRLHLVCTTRSREDSGAVAPHASDITSPSFGETDDSQSPQAPSPAWASALANVFEGHLLSSQFADWIALIDHEHRSGSEKHANLANSAALVDLPIPCEDDEAGLATFLPPTALNNLTGVTPFSLKNWSFGQRHLLNHFLQSVSRSLVVADDEHNPFLRIVVPMVLENHMVRQGLLAVSASHLSRVYPVFKQDLLIHRSLALKALRADIIHHEALKGAVVTTLLLCLAEICEGQSRTWLLHLYGAKALIATADAASLSDEPLATMLELYQYICCLASASSNDVPPMFQPRAEHKAQEIHPLFGIAFSLYSNLPKISQLAIAMKNGSVSDQEIQARAHKIELALQSWVPWEDTQRNRHRAEARAAAFATQWALILRLNQVTKKLRNDDPQITKAANNILSAISLIRSGSEIEAHILFPLFMAGVGSVTKPNRLTVEYRLSIMETTIGFGNISIAHRLLDELWRRSNSGETVDWEELKDSKYPGLVLL